jgi:hypothetical protein
VRTLFYDDQPLAALLAEDAPSIFLAGPTLRGARRTPWRAVALALLAARGYDGAVLLPEVRDGRFDDAVARLFGAGASPVPHQRVTSYNILAWETAGIEGASVVLFWMPFDATLTGLTTRAEVSRELARDPARIVLGMPPSAASGGHIRYHAHRCGVRIWDTLEETVAAALSAIAG